ncbi:chitobiase/beta-hexosaminidase C-terminal domain-containing protein [bacterium]|nr:chitobiase/beta-hexosaminidase C-terminal domain-containing protein [bacterium]
MKRNKKNIKNVNSTGILRPERLSFPLIGYLLIGILLLFSFSFAVVDIVNSPNVGLGEFERNAENGTYSVDIYLWASATDDVSLIEANVSYNNTIFYDVTISNPDAINSESGAIWETSEVNAQFDTNGNYTMVKYLKANTVGSPWTLVSPGDLNRKILLYTLEFKITRNAELSSEYIPFDSRWADVQNDQGDDITGALTNYSYDIQLDTTVPSTNVTPGGGYYNSDTTVNLETTETADEATIYYTKDNTNPHASGIAITSSGDIQVTGAAAVITTVTVNYYSVDWALGGPNTENAGYFTQVYYIDKEDPTINAVSNDAGPLAVGNYAYVTFNVNDASGQLYDGTYPRVDFTGGAATLFSGSGMNQYVFRKQLATGDNNGSGYSDITITMRDKAGNEVTYNMTDAVLLDFGGPIFEINVTPNPADFLTTASITVTASEELDSDPSVIISPDNSAIKVTGPDGNNKYVFDFFVTGNGWTATVPWLESGSFGDDVPPNIGAYSPTADAVNKAIETDIVFDITDNISISTNSITVTINNNLAIQAGVAQSGYTILLTPFTGGVEGYRVSVDPDAYFDRGITVSVQVYTEDGNSNSANLTYSFGTEGLLSEVYVSVNGSDLTGVGTTTNPFQTPQKGLNNVAASGAVYLWPGTYPLASSGNIIWPDRDNIWMMAYAGAGGTSANVILDGESATRGIEINHNITAVIQYLTIQNCSANYNGGGILVDVAELSLYQVRGLSCSSNSGVGGFLSAEYNSTTINMNYCEINNNYAYSYGGAINSYGVLNSNYNTFSNNYSEIDGGAIFDGYYYSGDNNIFNNNYALNYGGAIFTSSGKYFGDNNIFINNSADVGGGAVCLQGDYFGNNNIFYNNTSSEGGAVFNDGSYYQGVNNIFISNNATSGKHIEANGSDIVMYTCVYPFDSGSVSGFGFQPGVSGNIITEPIFVDAANGDFRLATGSIAINAGTNDVPSPSYDMDGNWRVRVTVDPVDMGPFEWQGAQTSANFVLVNLNTSTNYNQITLALDRATAADTLAVYDTSPSYNEGIQITINKDITLTSESQNSANVTISGGQDHRIIFITNNAKVTINYLTLKDGYLNDNGHGAGIYFASGSLFMEHVRALTCTANRTSGTNGWGGFLRTSGQATTINNCLFEGNYGYRGGAINYQNGINFINNNVFKDNSVNGDGGAIYNTYNASDYEIYLNNNIFENNLSTGGGGGIFIDETIIAVNNLYFNNEASYGGAIYINQFGDINEKNSIFYLNKASGSGSQLYILGSAEYSYSCIPSGNAGLSGDTFTFDDTDHNITANPSFVNAAGEDFHLKTGSILINAGTNDVASPSYDLDGNFRARVTEDPVDIGAYEYQGAQTSENFVLINLDTSANYNQLTLAYDRATAGDRLAFYPTTNYDEGSQFEIDKDITLTSYDSNSSNVVISGGENHRIIVITDNATVTINYLTLRDGQVADENGGGILLVNGSLLMENVKALSCSTNGTNTASNYGGFLYIDSGQEATTNYCLVSGNKSYKEGGAIYIENNAFYNGNTNNYIDNSVNLGANSDGGVIYIDLNGTYTGDYNNFQNSLAFNGGVIVVRGTYLGDHNEFKDNTATNLGGAILMDTSSIYRGHYNLFENNRSNATSQGGGAIRCNGTYYGDHNNFYNNHTKSMGGAVYLYNDAIYYGNYNTFEENTATNNGGAISNRNDYYGHNNVFKNNLATSRGGAVYNDIGTTYEGDNNLYYSNSAVSNGGAIYNDVNANVKNNNNTFVNNISSSSGGAIYNNIDSDYICSNNIFINNDATLGSQIRVILDGYGEAFTTVSYSCIPSGNSGLEGFTLSFDETDGNITDPPNFVNASGDDYHLATGSILINAGTNSDAPTEDIEGNPRALLVSDPADIGAYEWQGPTPNNFIVHNRSKSYYNQIQLALDRADAGNTLELVTTNTYDEGAEIEIDKDITLTSETENSSNYKISGGGDHRIILITDNADVIINHLTLKDGFLNSENGAGIALLNGSLLLENVNGLSSTCNSDPGSGGFLYILDQTATINKCQFKDNYSFRRGGVILLSGGSLVCEKSLFKDNFCQYDGGVLMSRVGGTYKGINNIYKDNRANISHGGALHLQQSFYNAENEVFNNNRAISNGGALYFDTSTGNISNTILYQNYDAGTDDDIYLSSSSSTIDIKNSSITNGNDSLTGFTLPFDNTDNNITGDPLFRDAANDDFQLSYGSACIDTGTDNVSITLDIRGMPRPIYDAYDMGTYEYEYLYLNEFSPANASTYNATSSDITFRVRDYAAPSGDIILSLTVNGTDYTSYTIPTDNSDAGVSTDMYVFFDIAAFGYGASVNVTVNGTDLLYAITDDYWFEIAGNPNLVLLSRTYQVIAPTANGYTGNDDDLVPGSKIRFTVVIENQGETMGYDCSVRDLVPVNTHLYDIGANAEPPTLNGNAINVEYQGVTGNPGSGSEVKFKFDLDAGERVTFNYTVTLD